MQRKWFYDLQTKADELLKEKYNRTSMCNYQLLSDHRVIESRWAWHTEGSEPVLIEVHYLAHNKSVMIYEMNLVYSIHQ